MQHQRWEIMGMRYLLVLVSGLCMSACGTENTESEAINGNADENTASDELTAAKPLYYAVRLDTRRCLFPVCGGYWVHALNKKKTRCLDGRERNECYVATIETSGLDLSEEELANIQNDTRQIVYRGVLGSKQYPHFGRFGELVAYEAWQAASETPYTGKVYDVSDNHIVCITTPCFSLAAKTVNTTSAAITVSGLLGDETLLEGVYTALSTEHILGAGKVVRDKHAGPAGVGRALKLSQYFTRVQHRDGSEQQDN